MEFLLVQYPGERKVLLQNDVIGWTNEVIEIESGVYTISLDGDKDFTPANCKVNVRNTSVLDPQTIIFTPEV